MDVELVKQYLRIDTDDDDNLIELMMGATEDYIKDAVGREYDANNKRMNLLYLAIMQELYENRTYTIKEAEKRRLAYVVGSIVLQLQCEEVDEGLTSENSTSA